MGFADLARSDLVVSESTWNTTVTLDEAKAGPFGPAYMYSKTEAEKKTWAWVQEHASSIGFDVVQLLPSSITGRSPQVTFKPDAASPGGIPQVYNALMVDKTAKAVDGYFPFVV
jgi:NADPH-dependent methylglyoxal reductase